MTGVWYKTQEDAAAHQAAMDRPSYGTHAGIAVSPMASGRLDPPDICLIYASRRMISSSMACSGPAAAPNGLRGESSCADSRGRA